MAFCSAWSGTDRKSNPFCSAAAATALIRANSPPVGTPG
jgi:hypothetical protein